MKKSLLIFAALLAGIMAAHTQQLSNDMKKLLNAEYAISNFYVDSVKSSELVENAIIGMLEKLDPHSQYTNASETKELDEPLQGEFSGIGVSFNMNRDTLYVLEVISGGPSERVGILPGDRIITVNDTTIAGVKMKNSDIMKRLRGKKGTKVTVKVKRGNQIMTFRITRDKIPLYSVDASYMIDRNTGYIQISRFGAKTHEEMMEAIDLLRQMGMKQLIIDLGDNGGGYLNAAIDMSNEFLARDQLIVFIKGENAPRDNANADGRGRLQDMPLVIIVDQYSASASEIFTGAMQDWDRAVVVGRRTFGKGLVQRPFRFEDGSMMRLTIARYYTPSGRCIQKPYTKGDKGHYEDDIYNRYKEGEYYSIDSIQFNDTLRYTTLRNHRTIYGGGGIMPDVFVPVDTSRNSKYYRDMMAKGLINQFAIAYVDRNRSKLAKTYKTLIDFDRNFSISDNDLKEFIALGEKEEVKFDEKGYETSKSYFKLVIKALIARSLFNDRSAYTVVVNHENPDVQKALEIINNPQECERLLREGNTHYEKIAERHKQQRLEKKMKTEKKAK